jgi:HSP20 family protein
MIPFGRTTTTPTRATPAPMMNLRREMDRVFDDFFRGVPGFETDTETGMFAPSVDLAETENGLELTADLPGVKKDDIDLRVDDSTLTLRAEVNHEDESKDEGRNYYQIERARGSFMRRFPLPFEPDQDNITANFEDGVLKVSIPRASEDQSAQKRIEIKS